jgi:DNA-binding protein H-NS
MSNDVQALMAQRAELDRMIAQARKTERADAVAKVRSLMAEHGLTMADLSARSSPPAAKTAGRKVAPKYRDPATGDTWSGRGLQPKWLRSALAAGRKLTDFAL